MDGLPPIPPPDSSGGARLNKSSNESYVSGTTLVNSPPHSIIRHRSTNATTSPTLNITLDEIVTSSFMNDRAFRNAYFKAMNSQKENPFNGVITAHFSEMIQLQLEKTIYDGDQQIMLSTDYDLGGHHCRDGIQYNDCPAQSMVRECRISIGDLVDPEIHKTARAASKVASTSRLNVQEDDNGHTIAVMESLRDFSIPVDSGKPGRLTNDPGASIRIVTPQTTSGVSLDQSIGPELSEGDEYLSLDPLEALTPDNHSINTVGSTGGSDGIRRPDWNIYVQHRRMVDLPTDSQSDLSRPQTRAVGKKKARSLKKVVTDITHSQSLVGENKYSSAEPSETEEHNMTRSGLAQNFIQLVSCYQTFGTYLGFVLINSKCSRLLMLSEDTIVIEVSDHVGLPDVVSATSFLDRARLDRSLAWNMSSGDRRQPNMDHVKIIWDYMAAAVDILAALPLDQPLARLQQPDDGLWPILRNLVSQARATSAPRVGFNSTEKRSVQVDESGLWHATKACRRGKGDGASRKKQKKPKLSIGRHEAQLPFRKDDEDEDETREFHRKIPFPDSKANRSSGTRGPGGKSGEGGSHTQTGSASEESKGAKDDGETGETGPQNYVTEWKRNIQPPDTSLDLSSQSSSTDTDSSDDGISFGEEGGSNFEERAIHLAVERLGLKLVIVQPETLGRLLQHIPTPLVAESNISSGKATLPRRASLDHPLRLTVKPTAELPKIFNPAILPKNNYPKYAISNSGCKGGASAGTFT